MTAIRQAEGSPEPLNKTLTAFRGEHGDKYRDVKGVAGITNDVPRLLRQSPCLLGALSHLLPLEPVLTSLRDRELFTDH